MASQMTYGISQAKGRIRAAAAAYTTATAMPDPDPSHFCDLHSSSRQCRFYLGYKEDQYMWKEMQAFKK